MQLVGAVAIAVAIIIGSATIPIAYSQSTQVSTLKQLGEYKIVNVANIPHLQDKNGFFVFPAFCPTACSAAWAKSNEPPPRTETKAPTATSGNNVYVTWWSNKTGDWEVLFRASHDNGKTFGPKVDLSNSPNVTSNDAEISAQDKNVYVSWWERSFNGSEPVMRVSNDNGNTFGNIIMLSNATALKSAGNNTNAFNITKSSSASTNTPHLLKAAGGIQTTSEPFIEQYRIGAIKAEFLKPGKYSFSYFIKPLLGEFQNLASLQVITIPTSQNNGYVPLDKVSWYKYPYSTVGESVFKIDNPGTYIIGFGPAQGTALTKLEAQGVPSGFTLKYKLDPLNNVKILKADMDIQIKQIGHGISFQTVGYEDLSRNAVLSQAQQLSLDGLRTIGVSDSNAYWLIMRGVSNTMLGGADLRYPLGRNAEYAAMRINEFSPILHSIIANGDTDTAKITTAKILTYILTLTDDANRKGIALTDSLRQSNQLQNMWIQGKYEQMLPIAVKLSKEILPIVHPEWQGSPSFSIYRVNAKVADATQQLPLSGLPVSVSFGNAGSEKVVTTSVRGESIFIGPAGKFRIDGIAMGDALIGGMTNIDLVMRGDSGTWLTHATTYHSPISQIQ